MNASQLKPTMQYLSADCIIPIEGEPRFESVLVIADDGTIEGLYTKSELEGTLYEIKHYKGILCPGFINTHCHLELSWAKGLISEGYGLDSFIWQLEKYKKSVSRTYILKSIETAASKMELSGIVATADIANGINTLDLKNKSNQYFHTFIEVFGSDPAFADTIYANAESLEAQLKKHLSGNSVSIVPHATYSLSDELFRMTGKSGKGQLLSIHHQENEEENLFFKDGSGPIASRRQAFNPDLPVYPGTGKRPMESIAYNFDRDQTFLLVHNTVTEQQDIDFVQHYFSHPYWCLCPNANLYIEKHLPEIDLFRRNKCKITLGTDSLASNHQLSILEEIKTIQMHFPHIPLTELIGWGTINGAEFLGLEQKLGSFVKGKCPGVVLIENADIKTMHLKPESTSSLIIPALI